MPKMAAMIVIPAAAIKKLAMRSTAFMRHRKRATAAVSKSSDRSDCDERWALSIREEMKEAPVRLKSTLVETSLSLREVKQLRAGDVIAIDLPDLVTIEAEGTPVFRGKYGVHDGNRAVQVTQKLTPDQSEQ